MEGPQDPIQREADGTRDLYEVVEWEPRTVVDAIAVAVYQTGVATLRALVVALAIVILVAQFVLGGLGVVVDPVIGTLVLLSIVPALAVVSYIWYIDVTTREPLRLLVATFLLALLFAGFAAIINSATVVPFLMFGGMLGIMTPLAEGTAAFLGMTLFFFVIVGPIEEAVKVLAIRLYAYRSDRFDAVINGAVYGAAAGLGFATIENAIYIAQVLAAEPDGVGMIRPAGDVAAARALAGPGHVLFSAIAGFYLGLAKFNPDHAGPLVVKGILIAAVLHALYNTLVGPVPDTIAATIAPVGQFHAVFAFVVVYLSVVGYFLYRKIERYRRTYLDVGLE